MEPGLYSAEGKIEPPRAEVVERILHHCGLWQESTSRAPPDVEGMVQELDFDFSDRQIEYPESDHTQELTYVEIGAFLAHTF